MHSGAVAVADTTAVRIDTDVWKRARAACALRNEHLSRFVTAAVEARLRGVVQVDEAMLAVGGRVIEAVEWPSGEGSVSAAAPELF